MTELPKSEEAENEHSLDPRERWGQGTDASHPISAIDAVDPETPTAADAPSTLDDGEITETADLLRRQGGRDRHGPDAAGRDDRLPGNDEDGGPDAIPDDLPLA